MATSIRHEYKIVWLNPRPVIEEELSYKQDIGIKCIQHSCCHSTQHHWWRHNCWTCSTQNISLHYVWLDEVHTCVLSKEIANTYWICHSIDSIFSVKNVLAIYAQTQPTNLSAPHITKHNPHATEYWWKKVGKLLWFTKFAEVFPLQSFLLYSTRLLPCMHDYSLISWEWMARFKQLCDISASLVQDLI